MTVLSPLWMIVGVAIHAATYAYFWWQHREDMGDVSGTVFTATIGTLSIPAAAALGPLVIIETGAMILLDRSR